MRHYRYDFDASPLSPRKNDHLKEKIEAENKKLKILKKSSILNFIYNPIMNNKTAEL